MTPVGTQGELLPGIATAHRCAPMAQSTWWLLLVAALLVTGAMSGPPDGGAGVSASSSAGTGGTISPTCPLPADAVSGRVTSPFDVGEGMTASWRRPQISPALVAALSGTASDSSPIELPMRRIAIVADCTRDFALRPVYRCEYALALSVAN